MDQSDLFQIEVAALNAWPAPRQMIYDGWLLRFTGGHSKRVNSVNPLYASTLPLADKIAFCEAIFARQGQPSLYRIGDFIDQSALKKALATSGYMPFDPTFVLGKELALEEASHPEPTILEMPVADWFRMRAQFITVSAEDQQAHEAVIHSIVPEKVLMGMFVDGQPVACGMGVAEGPLMGFFSIYTAAHWRRRGYAEMIMSALTDWGLQHDATFGYLQVEGHNRPALKLYQKLGYEQCYSYVYYEKVSGG